MVTVIVTESLACLVLDILVTEFQLHDALKRAEECLVKVEVRRLIPVCQNFS